MFKGALRFDLDEVADLETYKNQPILPLPHMVPSEKVFADWMTSHNISHNDHVVIYDTPEVSSLVLQGPGGHSRFCYLGFFFVYFLFLSLILFLLLIIFYSFIRYSLADIWP